VGGVVISAHAAEKDFVAGDDVGENRWKEMRRKVGGTCDSPPRFL